MGTFSLRLPDELEARVDEEGRRQGRTRSEVVRSALEEFVARKERERVIASFVAEARAGYGNPVIRREALAIAAEALPSDNEALASAEGARPDRPSPRRSRHRAAKR